MITVFRLFLCLVGLTPVLYGITLFLCKVLPRKFQVTLKRYSNMLITCRRKSQSRMWRIRNTHTDLKLKIPYFCHNARYESSTSCISYCIIIHCFNVKLCDFVVCMHNNYVRTYCQSIIIFTTLLQHHSTKH